MNERAAFGWGVGKLEQAQALVEQPSSLSVQVRWLSVAPDFTSCGSVRLHPLKILAVFLPAFLSSDSSSNLTTPIPISSLSISFHQIPSQWPRAMSTKLRSPSWACRKSAFFSAILEWTIINFSTTTTTICSLKHQSSIQETAMGSQSSVDVQKSWWWRF